MSWQATDRRIMGISQLSEKHSYSKLTMRFSMPAILLLAYLLTVTSVVSGQDIRRTEHGFPDFQGYWNNLHQTPLQRPVHLGNKQTYSAEEALQLVELEQQAMEERVSPLDPDRAPPEVGSRITNQADDDFDEFPIGIARVNGEYRTSLVIDPPDGRIPLKEESERDDFFTMLVASGRYLDGPEFGWAAERCLIAGPQLSMMFQRGLSPYAQIVQTEDYLMILGEYPYDARIIRINGSHPEFTYPKWMGDSIAHWEDDTLVIHTNKFRDEHSYPPILSSESFEVEERLSLTPAGEILYRYTVTDPALYTQPFTAEIPFTRMEAGRVLYEYACHEGNYSWEGSLRGARVQERLAAEN
ncbi:MAG: hypothetical protein OXU30_00590 [Gammaproteobacteria bacterium]|nr:hypothetical protein [Gammaproteobacteria bacterium]